MRGNPREILEVRAKRSAEHFPGIPARQNVATEERIASERRAAHGLKHVVPAEQRILAAQHGYGEVNCFSEQEQQREA